MKRSSIFLVIFFIIGLQQASAAVLINEIAWMGTTVSANAEWVELFNNGSESVSLEGWSLKAADGSPSINLTGVVAPGSYFILERTSDESIPDITANQIYSGSLGNTGEDLVLRNNVTEIIDEVNNSNGWSGGDNTSKQTMQLINSSWMTALGTPGLQNYSDTPTVSSTTTVTATTSVVSSRSLDEDKAEVIMVQPDIKYSAKMMLPDFATAGTPIPCSVEVKQGSKTDKVTGRFEWYLGDGSAYRYFKNTDFEHVFYYPGDYTVVMEYYSNYFKKEPDSIHKKIITIIPASIEISRLTDDGGIEFNNTSSKEISLDKWKIVQGNNEYVFPKYTIVGKSKSLSISSKTLGFVLTGEYSILLINSNSTTVTSYDVQKNE